MNTLIRLHSTENNGIFDCIFQDGVEIKPKSELALQSVSLHRALQILEINATNDLVQYQIQANQGIKDLRLPHGTYTRKNIIDLITSIQDQINQNLDINFTKNFGSQINLHINQDEKLVYHAAYSGMTAYARQNNPLVVSSATINTASQEIKQTGAAGGAFGLNRIYSILPFTKGCGAFRTRLKRLVNEVGGGFTMGLINSDNYPKLQDGTITEADISFGFRIPEDPSQVVARIINGVKTNSTVLLRRHAAGGGANNDIIDIQSTTEGGDGKLKIILHSTDGNNDPRTEEIASADYTRGTDFPGDLYAAIFIHGSAAAVRLDRVGHNPDPFRPAPNFEVNLDIEDTDALSGLTAPNPPNFNNVPTAYNLIFDKNEVADFLGYSNLNQNPNSDITNEGIYIANDNLSALIITDTYLIEMLNLNLNSYDSLAGGRKNILSSIPISEEIISETGVLQYEPNNLLFISLNNVFPITLRNIRVRVVSDDFEPIETEGLSTISLILKNPVE